MLKIIEKIKNLFTCKKKEEELTPQQEKPEAEEPKPEEKK